MKSRIMQASALLVIATAVVLPGCLVETDPESGNGESSVDEVWADTPGVEPLAGAQCCYVNCKGDGLLDSFYYVGRPRYGQCNALGEGYCLGRFGTHRDVAKWSDCNWWHLT